MGEGRLPRLALELHSTSRVACYALGHWRRRLPGYTENVLVLAVAFIADSA
jgi:hypothetical protein